MTTSGTADHEILTAVLDKPDPPQNCVTEEHPHFDNDAGIVRPMKILVAEDIQVNRILMSRMLTCLGYRPDVVGNGREAVEAAQRVGYDVILMDDQMPIMSGPEAAHLIQTPPSDAESPRPPRPWIIALTAHNLEGDREKYLRMGMDDYISKPVDIDRLSASLRNAWNQRLRQGNVAQGHENPTDSQAR